MNNYKSICLVIVFFVLFFNAVIAQDIILKGIIKDKISKKPLPYTNIGIAQTAIGTISDPNGRFELHISAADTLSVEAVVQCSYLAYQDVFLDLKNMILKDEIEVLLSPSPVKLNQIEVVASKLYPKIVGSKKVATRRSVNFAINKKVNQNLGAAIGKKIAAKSKTLYLDQLNFYIQKNNFDTIRFRIFIYKIENERPTELLNEQDIIVEIQDQRKGWITIDLRSFGLIYQQDVMVSLEWIYHSEKGNALRLPIAMPAFTKHYYRYGSQNNWKIYRGMSTAMYMNIRID